MIALQHFTFLVVLLLASVCNAKTHEGTDAPIAIPAGDTDECLNVDLSNTLGPVRDQKILRKNWCYAMTAADLLSQVMHQSVSAKQMVWEFQKAYPGKSLLSPPSEGGIMRLALLAVMQRGKVCTEKDLPTSATDESQILSNGFRSITEARTMIENEVRAKCQLSTPILSGYGAVSANTSPGQFKGIIDDALASGRIAAAGFPANFLMPQHLIFRPAAHWASIVGRRRMNGKCQYKIRNSWGPDCKQYPSPYDKQCIEGNIWVDQDIILPKLREVDYIPATPPPAPARDTGSGTVS